MNLRYRPQTILLKLWNFLFKTTDINLSDYYGQNCGLIDT
jgi:hypothetical protein